MGTQEKPTVLKRADISARIAQTPDLEERYPRILNAIVQDTGFTPEEEIGKSTWWGRKVGAVMYKGMLPIGEDVTAAVLKIEGVRMQPDEITEAAMIHRAEEALSGSGIRPPKVYREIAWTEAEGGYSAIFLEDVPTDSPVLPLPGTPEAMEALLTIRERYRAALRAHHVTPWVAPEYSIETEYLSRFVNTKFAAWRQTSHELFPRHPFREDIDEALMDKAIAILENGYAGIRPEFQQGHFSHRDVVRVGSEIVMFSNLYWSWRAPFYDVVFPAHWYLYDLANVPGITIDQLAQQKAWWEDQYRNFTEALSHQDQGLFSLARLERLAAGLNLDALSISTDPQNEIARFLVDETRKDLTTALEQTP